MPLKLFSMLFGGLTAVAFVFGSNPSCGQTLSTTSATPNEVVESAVFGSIHGKVIRNDGLSAIGTKIVLHDTGRQSDTVVVASPSSEFQVASMPPGKYEVRPAGGAAVPWK